MACSDEQVVINQPEQYLLRESQPAVEACLQEITLFGSSLNIGYRFSRSP